MRLDLCWAGERTPSTLHNINHYWQQSDRAWIDLTTGKEANYAGASGHKALKHLLQNCLQQTQRPLPELQPGTQYYDASLLLLAHIAQQEGLQ